ncbi:MAG: hypothetical protein CMJ65_12835 [Planctomycetaceae bacterium]|nr:hypothetical protein [Planctomycetaceae bacterium]MDP7273877.1 hypothetical protein [Planctomycetaceae bacterium]
MKFYYIYKALAHPENNGYVRPFTLKERLAHVGEAQRTLGSQFAWICDAMDNRIKHALGNAPNSEFVIDPGGRVVRKRSWSDPEVLRKDLVELVGPVEKPTDPESLELKTQAPPRAAARGVVERIEIPEGLRAVMIKPQLSGEKDADPFYAKLRAEADGELLRGGQGKLYLRFMMDPLYHVHWNNLVEPIRIRFVSGDQGTELDSRVTPGEWTGPKVKEAADIDPRELLVAVDTSQSRQPLRLVVKYFACHDKQGWCKPVTQVYSLAFQPDRDGGRVTSGRRRDQFAGRGGGRGQRPGSSFRPRFGDRPGFGGRPGSGERGFERRRGFGGRPRFPLPERQGPATAVFGRIAGVDVGSGRLTIAVRDGGNRDFRVTDKTPLQRNRRSARLADCRKGDRIVVRIDPDQEPPLAVQQVIVRGEHSEKK